MDVMPATVAATAVRVMMRLITVAPAADLVASRKICMNGKPVGVERRTSKPPVEKSNMMQ